VRYIRFVANPTERTTAATDVLLAILAIGAVIFLSEAGASDVRKSLLWVSIYAMVGFAAALGAIVHGLVLPQKPTKILWAMLYLALGQIVALFGAAAIYDIWGWRVTQIVLPLLIMGGLCFLGMTAFWSASFLVFITYQLAVMLFALGVYLWLSVFETLPGARWMVAGILVTVAASVLQTRSSMRIIMIWEFDHNGVYHLVQAVGLVLLVIGLWLGLAG
jgi:hypothetical protein